MRRIVFACSCIIVFAVVALGAAKPKEKKKPEISPHAQAIQLVMATQQKKIREVDRNNWWHDVKEREWKAKRPFFPGHIDSTHMFVVSYHIDGKAVHSWFVDTRKKTVQSRKIEPAPAVKADTVPEPASVPKKGVTVTIRQSDEDAIRGLLAQLLEHLNRSYSSAPPDYVNCKPHEDLMTYGWKAVPYLIEQVALRERVDAYIGSALIDDHEVDTPKEVYDYNLARRRAVDSKTLGPHILASLLRELPSGNEVPSLDTSKKTISAGAYNSVFAWLNWWQESKHRFTFRTKRPPVIAPPKDRHSLVPQITVSYKNKLLTLYAVRSSIKEIIKRGAAEMEVNIVVPEPHGRQPVRPMSGTTTTRMKCVTTGEFLYRVGRMIWGIPYDKMDEKLELGSAMQQPRGAAAKPESTIDENTARKLAIEQYNKLFRDKYILNPLDAKHHKFPELDAKYFHKAEIKDRCWQLAGAPPAGWFVFARVSLDGKWVQLTSVGFALK